jgi:chorismate dehydratase
MNGLRVGAVSYLNAQPLYHRLETIAPYVRLELDLPSRLADRLERGELDVALIPSIEYLRGSAHGYSIIPGFAIAARGAVRSVKLYSRVPFCEIRRLALDEGSRTSQALARIWLDRAHGIQPEAIEQLPIGMPVQETTADAVLLIGDRAMRDPDESFHALVDLAEAWREMTGGLPFVFALWVARADVELGELPIALEQSRASGLDHASEIAQESAARMGFDSAFCFDYITNVISYDLGHAELAGLQRFSHEAARLGLAPEGVDLVFYDDRRLDLATRR